MQQHIFEFYVFLFVVSFPSFAHIKLYSYAFGKIFTCLLFCVDSLTPNVASLHNKMLACNIAP